jgi:putative nucleotidyltransferase with HDIG domain
MLVLHFKTGPLAGEARRLSPGAAAATIGRQAANDVVVPLSTVSGQHGRFAHEGGQWRYEDLHSANGTRIRRASGEEVVLFGPRRSAVTLAEGDRLTIGECEIEVRFEHDPQWTVGEMTVVGEVGLADLDTADLGAAPGAGRALQWLHRFMRRVGRAEDEREAARELTRFAVRISDHARRAVLCELVDGVAAPRFAVDRRGVEQPVADAAVSQALAQAVAARQDGLLLVDVGRELPSESLHALGLRSVMATPVWIGERLTGLLIVEADPGAAPFGATDLHLLMFFVHHAAAAAGQLCLIRELNRAFLSSVKALLRLLDLRDPTTSAHSLKVQSIALEIARAMDLPPARVEVVRYAALLHDVGKLALPDEILTGRHKLTDAQRQVVNTHARWTMEILSRIEFPSALADVPRVAAAHHEQLDGGGALGLTAAEIPLEARILAVADVFEALTAARSYKEVERVAETLARLREMAGGHLDREVIDALEKAMTLG